MRLLQRSILIIFALMTLMSCDRTNDFNKVCSYFDMLEKEIISKNLTPDQKYEFINDLLIKNIPTDSPALESWKAVIGFEPVEGRYSLYEQAAEATLKKSWQCYSMRDLLKGI